MSRARLAVPALIGASIMLASACASHKVKQPELPGEALVTLLPDPETGNVGKATVSNANGRVELTAARESTLVRSESMPQTVTVIDQGDVRRLFGETLSALPPAQRHFTLFFRFDSEELTPESLAMAPEILREVRDRRVPEVLIVGHTDTTGTRASNFVLGLRRANTVRSLLRETGIDSSFIDVVSHGETELLVPTGNGIFEARNRRVEITVR